MKRFALTIVMIVMAVMLIVAGCGKKTPEPAAVNEKTDKCALCNMAVKNDHSATEVILENGKVLKFDDLGCLVKWTKQNKDKKLAVSYVRDYNKENWIQLEKATYVHDNKFAKTPMAYNVISFANKEDAQKFISEKSGKLLTYEDLKKYSWERDPAAMKHSMKMNMNMKKGQGKMDMDMDKNDDNKNTGKMNMDKNGDNKNTGKMDMNKEMDK